MEGSPRRDAAFTAMMRYVDALVSVLIRTATQAPDPLLAVSSALVGENDQIAQEASAGDLRSLLFAAYNAYDAQNARMLPHGSLTAFFHDFVDCYATQMSVLGPDLCTTPDETWEDRSRWDTVGNALATKASKLRNGFRLDPDVWVRRWAQLLEMAPEGRGASFTDIQTVFAGAKTPLLLKEINFCIMLSDRPASPAQQPPLDDYSPGRHRSLSPVGERSAPGANPLQPPRDGFQVTMDLSHAACALRAEGHRLRGTCYLMYYVVSFALVAVVLLMQMGAVETQAVHGAVVTALVKEEFAPTKSLEDVQSIDDVYAWLSAVWAPAVFADFQNDRFAARNALAADPFLRQRQRGFENFCEPDTNIQAYPFADALQCYSAGYSDAPLVGREGTNRTYYPVAYEGPYRAPSGNGSDYVVVFPVDPTAARAAANGSTAPPTVVTDVSTARAALALLQADRWLRESTAFLECHALFYNPELDVIAPTKVVFSVSPAGVVLPLAEAHAPYGGTHGGSVLLARRAALYDWDDKNIARFVIEIVVLLMFVVEFVAGEFRRCVTFSNEYTTWWGHFTTDFWNVFELAYFLVGAVYIVLYVVLVEKGTPDAGVYSLQNQSGWYIGLDDVYPVLVVFGGLTLGFAMLRVLRYVEHVSLMTKAVARILQLVATPFWSLLVLFMVAVVTFAAVAHYIFGPGLATFSTYGGSVQAITQVVVHGVDFEDLNSPFADPSYGVFPPIFYWALVVALLVLYISIVVSIFAHASSAVADELTKNRRDAMDVPSTGRAWSARSLLYNFSNYSSTLIADWRRAGWIVPVAHKHVVSSSVVTAEVVGKGNLRIIVLASDLEKLAGCSAGVVFVLPPECLTYDLTQPRTGLLEGWCSVTKCQAGYEPRHYPNADWMQYLDDWWMSHAVVADYTAGGALWMGVEDSIPHIHAPPQELHRRELWLRHAVATAPELLENSDPAVTNATSFVKFRMGCYRARALQIHTPCRDLFGPPRWKSECLVFEFQGVVSSKWPGTTLAASGIYRTLETHRGGRGLVVTLGDQPVPEYVSGSHERFTQDVVVAPYEGRPVKQYVEDMVVGRFGISHERTEADDPRRPPAAAHDPVAAAMAALPPVPHLPAATAQSTTSPSTVL